MVTLSRREEKENIGQKKLEKAKLTVKALAMDQDGTVKGGDDPKFVKANVAELLQKISQAGKTPVILTASGASALKSFSEINFPAFIGIGNGTALYQFNQNGKKEIYNQGLSLDEVKAIVGIWQKVYEQSGIHETDLQSKGVTTFKEFMEKDWSGYIPKEYVAISEQYGGCYFTEEIKVTVVFPSWNETKQRDLVGKMQTVLDQALGKDKYLARRGDENFLHITHAFEIDPKLFALRKIMEELKLDPDEVAVFGDLPLDNDRGMLIESGLPYTFTNCWIENLEAPPYLLPGSSVSMVGSVRAAIDYLLS